LLDLVHHNRQQGEGEIERLIESYPSQRKEALLARTMWIAEQAGNVTDLRQLDLLLAQLPEGDKGYLAQTKLIRGKVAEIVRQYLIVQTASQTYVKELNLQLLKAKISAFDNEIAGFNEPLASGFRKAANQWKDAVKAELQKQQEILHNKPVRQVFRAGDPVNKKEEAFVPRLSVIGDVERQLLMASGCPGLVIYGRRRTGKSTLLQNLPAFLPDNFTFAVLSMQNPHVFTDTDFFVRSIYETIKSNLPPETAKSFSPDSESLTGLHSALSNFNKSIGQDRRLIIAIDEYENIDDKIGEAVFTKDLLAALRESMQEHRRITWVFSGSHEITELEHAQWTSYLVSARTIVIPFFSFDFSQYHRRSRWWGVGAEAPHNKRTNIVGEQQGCDVL
jgi:hypothetical protein